MIVKWANKRKKWLMILSPFFLLVISSIVALACYQPNRLQLQQQLSQRLHYPVKIQSASLRWRYLQPHLYLSKVTIESQNKSLAMIKGINLAIDLRQSLLRRSWVLSNVWVQNAVLSEIPQASRYNGASLKAPVKWQSLYHSLSSGLDFQLPQTAIEIAHLSWDVPSIGLKIKKVNITDFQGELTPKGYQLHANISSNELNTKLSFHVLLEKVSHDFPVLKGDMNFSKFDLNDWRQSQLIRRWLQHVGLHQAVFKGGIQFALNDQGNSSGVLHLKAQLLSLSLGKLPSWIRQQPLGSSLKLEKVNTHLHWQQSLHQIHFSIPQTTFRFRNHHYQFHYVEFDFLNQGRQWYLKKIRTQHLPMSTLVRWGKYFHLSEKTLHWFEEDRIKGIIDFVEFGWTPSYHLKSLKVRFHQLSWRHYHHIPGVRAVKGDVTLFNKHIQFSFQSKNGVIFTKLLPYWHHYRMLKLQGDAVYFGENANVNIRHFVVDDSHLKLQLTGSLLLRHHHSPHVSLLGQFTFHDLSALQSYLPRYGLNSDLRAWLKQASFQGDLQTGRILWNGNLLDFPYANHKGRFVISAHMANFHLHFAPAWLPIEHMQGDLSFVNQGLYIHASSAIIHNNSLTSLKAEIKDLNHSRLRVSSQASGPMDSLLTVLKQSPLPLARRIKTIASKGVYQLALRLWINLDKVNQTHVLGQLAFKHDKLALSRWHLKLSNIVGMLNFTEHAIWSSSINTRFLGSPVNLFVKTDGHVRRRVAHLIANGNYSWSSLLNWANLPRLSSMVKGNLFAKVNLGLPFFEHQPMSIQIKSPLVGTELSLPAPLSKRAALTLPLSLEWVCSEKGLSSLVLNLRSKLSTKLYWLKQLNSLYGLIRLGHAVSIPIHNRGVNIIGELKKININQWAKSLNPFFNQAHHSLFVAQLPQLKANVLIHQVSVLDHVLKGVLFKANIKHAVANLMINSPSLNGGVKLPLRQNSKSLVAVNIDNAFWRTKKAGLLTDFNPLKLPPLVVDIRHLRWNHLLFSHVHFNFKAKGQDALFHHVLVQSPWYQVNGQARWTRQSSQVQKTTVSGKAFINNLQGLNQFDKFTKLFANGKLGLAFDLSWPAGLLQTHVKQWSGKVVLKGSDGTILVNHHLYHALVYLRLINILNVSSILQNLSTGFNSFWAQGIEFSSLIGNLDFDKGKLKITKLSIDGQNLQLKLVGQLDLQKKSMNMDLFLNPKLTSSMPLIAGLAGGPLVGAATWVMNQLLSPVVSQANVKHYQLTGSWQAPKLVKIDPIAKTVSSL